MSRNLGPWLGSALVVHDVDAPAGASLNIVYVEVAHRPTVEVQADSAMPLRRNSCDVNVIWIRHKARHCAASKQDGAAARQLDVLVGAAIRRQPHVAALLQDTFDDADDPPASVIVHGRPLAWKPDDRVQREAFVRSVEDEIACVARIAAPIVLGLQKATSLIDQIEHQGCKGKHAVGRVGRFAAPGGGLSDEGFEGWGGHE